MATAGDGSGEHGGHDARRRAIRQGKRAASPLPGNWSDDFSSDSSAWQSDWESDEALEILQSQVDAVQTAVVRRRPTPPPKRGFEPTPVRLPIHAVASTQAAAGSVTDAVQGGAASSARAAPPTRPLQPASMNMHHHLFPQYGRSFVKIFGRPFSHSLIIPRQFAERWADDLLPSVQIVGASPAPWNVAVVVEDGRYIFQQGWRNLVLGERLTPHDMALFVLLMPQRLTMRIYTHDGLEKPMLARPAAVDPDDAALHPVPVPNYVLTMPFEFGARVETSPQLMQQMVNVWVNHNSNHPVYACRLTKANIKAGNMYFSTRYSKQLHLQHDDLHAEADMFFGDELAVTRGGMSRVAGMVRVNAGFNKIIARNNLTEVDILIIAVFSAEDRFHLRFNRVPA